MRKVVGLLGVVVFLLLGFWLTRVIAVLGAILVWILVVAALADLIALIWGWARARAAYTVLAMGHDGSLHAMATAAREELEEAEFLAKQTYNPIERWLFFRDAMMWRFVWRRAWRQWIQSDLKLELDLNTTIADMSRSARWTGKNP